MPERRSSRASRMKELEAHRRENDDWEQMLTDTDDSETLVTDFVEELSSEKTEEKKPEEKKEPAPKKGQAKQKQDPEIHYVAEMPVLPAEVKPSDSVPPRKPQKERLTKRVNCLVAPTKYNKLSRYLKSEGLTFNGLVNEFIDKYSEEHNVDAYLEKYGL